MMLNTSAQNWMATIFTLVTGFAIAAPAVGILAHLPVRENNASKLISLEILVFTSEKLNAPATFSFFDDQGKDYDVGCCLDVTDINAIPAETLIQKYGSSPDFADSIKSVKGYKYIYRVAYSRTHKTRRLKLEQSSDVDGGILWFEPVAQVIIDKETAKSPFASGTSSITLKHDYKDGKSPRQIYTFTVDGQKQIYSFPEPLPD